MLEHSLKNDSNAYTKNFRLMIRHFIEIHKLMYKAGQDFDTKDLAKSSSSNEFLG